MVDANRNNTSINNPGFGSVANPIAMMMEEHENEGERFENCGTFKQLHTTC